MYSLQGGQTPTCTKAYNFRLPVRNLPRRLKEKCCLYRRRIGPTFIFSICMGAQDLRCINPLFCSPSVLILLSQFPGGRWDKSFEFISLPSFSLPLSLPLLLSPRSRKHRAVVSEDERAVERKFKPFLSQETICCVFRKTGTVTVTIDAMQNNSATASLSPL